MYLVVGITDLSSVHKVSFFCLDCTLKSLAYFSTSLSWPSVSHCEEAYFGAPTGCFIISPHTNLSSLTN